MQRKCGIYVRVSTEEQAQVQEGSIETQKHRINGFIEFKNAQDPGWGKAVEIYADEGLSAKDTRRPAFQRMMRDIRQGKINLILVTDLSRLSRNILDFCLLLEDLRKNSAKFLSIKEQFDTSTPAGEMMVFNMINLAQFERKQTSERVAMNFHARALRGLSNGGGLLLGYDKDPENAAILKVNEREAADVREIFRVFLEQGSCGKTIPVLNELGIMPKKRLKRNYRLANQGVWTRQNLLNLLRNPAYAGLREINKLNKSKLQEDLKPWQQHQMVKAAWPAIVSEEVFKRAKQTLDDAYMVQCQRLAKRVTRIFLGTGVLKCGECGAPYMGAASHGKNLVHRYYVHRKLTGVPLTCKNKRIPADNIENDIARHITEVLARDGYLDQIEGNIERNIKEAIADYVEQKNFLNGKLESLDKEIAEVFQLHRQMSGTPGVELVREKLAELSTQKTTLATQLGEIDDYIANVPTAKAARSVVEKGMGDFITAWKRATPSQQKKLVARLFMRLRVTAQGLGVRYRWTSPDQSACMTPETKKAVDSSPTATNSNLILLETHRSGTAVPFNGDFTVANASTAKNGRADWIRTSDPLVPNQMRYQLRYSPTVNVDR